jgi:hypothetical protein
MFISTITIIIAHSVAHINSNLKKAITCVQDMLCPLSIVSRGTHSFPTCTYILSSSVLTEPLLTAYRTYPRLPRSRYLAASLQVWLLTLLTILGQTFSHFAAATLS